MKRTTCAEFVNACNEQGAQLTPPPDDPGFFTQNGAPVELMIRKTARRLKSEIHQLTPESIQLPVLPDTESNILATIINATREPIGDEHPFYFGPQKQVYLTACQQAEGRFARALRALRTGQYDTPKLGGNILLKGGEVCAFQKSNGENSALALVPICINGIPYPAGSLVNVGEKEAPFNNLPHGFHLRELGGTALGFARLTAFAIPPDERESYFYADGPEDSTLYDAGPDAFDLLQSVTIEGLRADAAQAATQLRTYEPILPFDAANL